MSEKIINLDNGELTIMADFVVTNKTTIADLKTKFGKKLVQDEYSNLKMQIVNFYLEKIKNNETTFDFKFNFENNKLISVDIDPISVYIINQKVQIETTLIWKKR